MLAHKCNLIKNVHVLLEISVKDFKYLSDILSPAVANMDL